MTVKTYQAFSMAEALAAVRRDLGAEALIVSTRAFKRGGILGLGRQTIVEVTATTPEPDVTDPSRSGSPSTPTRRRAAARRAYADPVSRSVDTTGPSARPASSTIPAEAALEIQSARRMAAEVPSVSPNAAANNPTPRPPSPTPAPADAPSKTPSSPPESPPSPVVPTDEMTAAGDRPASSPPGGVPRRFILTPAASPANGATAATATVTSVSAATAVEAAPGAAVMTAPSARKRAGAPPAAAVESRLMQDELAAIRSMVGEVLQRQVTTGTRRVPALPQALFDTYLKLIAQDLSEELADQIVAEVRSELGEAAEDDAEAVGRAVRTRLAACIPVATDPVPQHAPDGRPLTIALIGPTGVGKTTTLAKLAATYKLRHRKRVGLVTSDTYRIAAVDQLRTYANIIGLPLQVALTPKEMDQRMHALADCDVVLIDTAGRSQNDADRLDELAAFMAAAGPHEVHLVLSSTAGEKVLLREAEAFGAVGFDRIVLTKLDEAVSFGMLVNVIRKVGTTLSFITTGQEVPEHLEVGRPDRLAELIMGGALNA
ncbi:MAG: flagellar biosynthesis protein FlhF [Planctomycetota bacterium]